jgi:hypothetical protein
MATPCWRASLARSRPNAWIGRPIQAGQRPGHPFLNGPSSSPFVSVVIHRSPISALVLMSNKVRMFSDSTKVGEDQDGFTASDVVALYLHRGAFEPVLTDEDQEDRPGSLVLSCPRWTRSLLTALVPDPGVCERIVRLEAGFVMLL